MKLSIDGQGAGNLKAKKRIQEVQQTPVKKIDFIELSQKKHINKK